jgi:hypothetical protein
MSVLSTIMVAAFVIAVYIEKRLYTNYIRIGDRVTFTLPEDDTITYYGTVMARMTYIRDEKSQSKGSVRRTVDDNNKINHSKYIFYEIRPSVGGEKVIVSEDNVSKDTRHIRMKENAQ